MRLRHFLGIAAAVALVGGGIWFFMNGTAGNALGAGGLPLIKADTSPVKIAPDDPGGDVMPNADSTVFTAMGADAATDPSMENLKAPTTQKPEAAVPDFAGLKTGFAVPAEAPKTTENLFASTATGTKPALAPQQPAPAPAPEAQKTVNDYVSGLAPDALTDDAPKPAPKTETKAVEKPTPAPVKAAAKEPVKEPVKKAATKESLSDLIEKSAAEHQAKKENVTPAAPMPITSIEENPAQAQEEQEKAIVAPAAKPAPVAKPVKAEVKKPHVKTDTVKTAPKTDTKAVSKTAAQMVAEDVAREASVKTPAPAKAAALTAPKTTPVSAASGYYMQLASTPSSLEAPKLWARLQGKYPGALSGLKPVYQTTTIPGKGEYIRVQAGPVTQQQATDRCKQLHAIDAKGGCLVFKR